MNKLTGIIVKLGKNRIIQHVLFWALSFKILLEMFSGNSGPEKIDYIYTSVFLFTIAIPVYLNLYIAIPRILSRRKYLLYSLSFLLLVFLFSGFNQWTFNRLIDYILVDYYFISYFSFVDIAKYLLVFLGLTTLIKFSKAWFTVSEAKQKMMELERQKIENELQALKSQINPHFMFNSLNSIYALSLMGSDKTPETILKLGDILRYVIYEAREEKVLLGKEIKLINDYIDLQKIRSVNSKISLKTENLNENVYITPLLFLPVLENGFKHGVKGDTNGYLDMILKQTDNKLIFIAENSKGAAPSPVVPKFNGIGLENTKRRLEISYPDNHVFVIFENEKIFRVEIILNLNT